MYSKPFEFGQRVSREVDIHHPEKGERVGTVIRRYSQGRGRWHDPEVYEVQWDGGPKDAGYFRHGLTPIN